MAFLDRQISAGKNRKKPNAEIRRNREEQDQVERIRCAIDGGGGDKKYFFGGGSGNNTFAQGLRVVSD